MQAALGAMAAVPAPPMNEVLEALKRAEEVSKFLREQTDFWMEQVRQIQKTTQSGEAQQSAAPVVNRAASAPVGEAAAAAAEAAAPSSPLADLRRIQQEKYEERKRSSASLEENSNSPGAP